MAKGELRAWFESEERGLVKNVRAEIRSRVPVKTGALRDSFRIEGDEVVSRAPYAGVVDKRKPYLTESIEAAYDKL